MNSVGGTGSRGERFGRRPAATSPVVPYARSVRRHLWLALSIVVLTVAASIAWLTLRTPTYEATAKMLVAPIPQDDDRYLGLPLIRASAEDTRTMQTAASLVDAQPIDAAAARDLGSPWTQAAVSSAVKVRPQGESNVLDVTASADTQADAVRLADAYVEAAARVRADELQREALKLIASVSAQLAEAQAEPGVTGPLEEQLAALRRLASGPDPTITVAQHARTPTAASGAPKWLVVFLALVAGSALALGTVLLVDNLLPGTVTDEDELEDVFPLPILSAVPAVRGRDRKYLGTELAPAGVRSAYRTLYVQLTLPQEIRPYPDDIAPALSIMFTSAGSGEGKTTSVLQLAVELAASEQRVVIIDLDPGALGIGQRLGVQPSQDAVLKVLGDRAPWQSLLSTVPDEPLINVLTPFPEGGGPDHEERLLASWPTLLADLGRFADFILVDAPPLGSVTSVLRYLPAMDELVLVARLGHTSHRAVERVRDLLARTGGNALGFVVVGTQGRVPVVYENPRVSRRT